MQKAGQVAAWVGLGLVSPSKLIMRHKMACLIKGNIFREVFVEYRGVFFLPGFLKESQRNFRIEMNLLPSLEFFHAS